MEQDGGGIEGGLVFDLQDDFCRQTVLKRLKIYLDTTLIKLPSFENFVLKGFSAVDTPIKILNAAEDIQELLARYSNQDEHIRSQIRNNLGDEDSYIKNLFKIIMGLNLSLPEGKSQNKKLLRGQLKYQNCSRTTTFSNIKFIQSASYFEENVNKLEMLLQECMAKMIHHEAHSVGFTNDPKTESDTRSSFNDRIINPLFIFFHNAIVPNANVDANLWFSSKEEIPDKLKSEAANDETSETEYRGKKDFVITYGPNPSKDGKVRIEFKNPQMKLDFNDLEVASTLLDQITSYMITDETNKYIVSNMVQTYYIEISDDFEPNASIEFKKNSKVHQQKVNLKNEVKVFKIDEKSEGGPSMNIQIFIAIRMLDLMANELPSETFKSSRNYRTFNGKSSGELLKLKQNQTQISKWKSEPKITGDDDDDDDEEEDEIIHKRMKLDKNTEGIYSRTRSKYSIEQTGNNDLSQGQRWSQISVPDVKYFGPREVGRYTFLVNNLKQFHRFQSGVRLTDEDQDPRSKVLIEGYEILDICDTWTLEIPNFKITPINIKENLIKVTNLSEQFQIKIKVLDKIQLFNSESAKDKINIPHILKSGKYALWLIDGFFSHGGPFISFSVPTDHLSFKPLKKKQVEI